MKLILSNLSVMKNIKSLSLMMLLAITVIPLTSQAQTTDVNASVTATASTSNSGSGYGLGGILKDVRSDIKKDREAMQARLSEERAKMKEEKKEILDNHFDKMKLINSGTTTASTTKDLFQQERDNFKQTLSDFRKTRIGNFTDRMFTRLNAAFSRFDQIISRLDEKVNELETKKVDVTQAKAALTDAKTAMSEGKVALADAKAKAEEIVNSGNPKGATAALNSSTKVVIEKLIDIRSKISISIEALKGVKTSGSATTTVKIK